MNRSRYISWFELPVVTGLILLGVFSRLWMLGQAAFRADTMEFYKYVLLHQNIAEFWKNPPWKLMIPVNETLSLLMLNLGLPATGFTTRLPFALMGIAAILFIWLFARRWFGAGAGIFALLLSVFNPYVLYHARDAYHYSGSYCWAAALLCAFWPLVERFKDGQVPKKKELGWWLLAATAACHMHISVWMVVLTQGVFILYCFYRVTSSEKGRELRFFLIGLVLLGILMFRWVFRAFSEVVKVHGAKGGGEVPAGMPSAFVEFARLVPVYFLGENFLAIALLFVFIVLALISLFCLSDFAPRYRRFTAFCIIQLVIQAGYLMLMGRGVTKITYFSAVWPSIILCVAMGAYLFVSLVPQKWLRICLYGSLAGGYVALSTLPNWAIIHLDGHPTPYYQINRWVQRNLPEGTPVLTDRWLDAWNELAVHNPGNLHYTFTVPDEPIDNYKRFNWPETVRQFFEKYPEAAFLELSRDRFAEELGPWPFPEEYFARVASLTNNAAVVLRRWQVFPTYGFSDANTNRVVVRIFYNTPEDLIAAARRDGKETLRLWNEGWGYAKPGWQQGHFEDYRLLNQAASIDFYNLTDVSLNGSLEISAATAERPKTVSVNGATTVFSDGRIRTWTVPLTLQPGGNTVLFTSPSADPLFVLDIRWRSSQP